MPDLKPPRHIPTLPLGAARGPGKWVDTVLRFFIAESRPLLERAYAQCPTDVNILNLLGLTRHHQGESASGSVLIRQALLLAPGRHGLLQNQELLSAACRESMVGAQLPECASLHR